MLGTGIRLTRSGRPFGTLSLNVHKLVALAAVVVVAVLVSRATPLSARDWAAAVSAALLCIVSFASGGVVSALESAPSWVAWAHRVGGWLAIVAVAFTVLRVV